MSANEMQPADLRLRIVERLVGLAHSVAHCAGGLTDESSSELARWRLARAMGELRAVEALALAHGILDPATLQSEVDRYAAGPIEHLLWTEATPTSQP